MKQDFVDGWGMGMNGRNLIPIHPRSPCIHPGLRHSWGYVPDKGYNFTGVGIFFWVKKLAFTCRNSSTEDTIW